MAAVVIYEVHVLRGRDWIIDHIAENRVEAIEEARVLIAEAPDTAVQVLEERFHPETGDVSTTVLFRAVPRRKDAATFRSHIRRTAPTAVEQSRRMRSLIARVAVVGVSAAGLIALGRLTSGW